MIQKLGNMSLRTKLFLEILDNLRAYLSFCRSCCEAESKASSCCAGGGNILVRHFEHDAPIHDCNLTEP
jgi:hypothetical protein